jgi:major membrane immunogen (membrane-anchored lipoprotein)
MPSLNQVPVRTRRSSRCLAVLAIPALVILASCGAEDDGLGKRYPVTGTVKYNGNPLEKGDISFVTEDMSKNLGATGVITNGSYKLSIGGEGDGAQTGKYKVTVTAKEDFTEKAQEDFKKTTGSTSPKVLGPSIAKASAAAKSLIPSGYGDSRTTTLKAEVEAKSNTINFDLSDADAPPEPAKAPTTGNAPGRRGRN